MGFMMGTKSQQGCLFLARRPSASKTKTEHELMLAKPPVDFRWGVD